MTETRGSYYTKIIESSPHGLDVALLKILQQRVGRANAVKKGELTALLLKMGFHVSNERQVRLSISRMRKAGHLIGSTNQDGYFTCADRKEYELVKNSELMARVTDILDTVRILDVAAREQWGDGVQEALF